MSTQIIFRPDALKYVGTLIGSYDPELIETHLNLRQASIDNALKYGGLLTREFLSKMDLRGDKKYTIVDTRISFLLPGAYPSIPGWHTDGVPRGKNLDPASKESPDIRSQLKGDISSPRYHLGVYGVDAFPEFVREPLALDAPHDDTLYKSISEQVNTIKPLVDKVAKGEIWEFDWWTLHRATPAIKRSWRYLIRVTESDNIPPRDDLNKMIRSHSQVYMPAEFGW